MNDIEMMAVACGYLQDLWCRWRHKKHHEWRSGAYRPEIKKVVEIYYCSKCKGEVPKVSERKFKTEPVSGPQPVTQWTAEYSRQVRMNIPLPDLALGDDDWPEIVE